MGRQARVMDHTEVCFTLSSLRCGNRVGLGKGSSRGRVALTAGVLGGVGVGEGGRGRVSVRDCSFWYPLSHSSK